MDLTQINALLSGIMGGSPQTPADPGQVALSEQASAQPEVTRSIGDKSFEAPSSVNLALPFNIAQEIERYSQRREGIDRDIEKAREILYTDPEDNRKERFKKTWAGRHPILSALHSVLVGAGGMPQASARSMAMQQIDADLNTKKQAAQQVLQTVLGEARLNKSEYDTNLKQSNEQFNQWMKQQNLTQTELKRQLEAQRAQINKELAEKRLDQSGERLALDKLYRLAQVEALADKTGVPTKAEWAQEMIRTGKWKQEQIDNYLGASSRKPGAVQAKTTTYTDENGKPIGSIMVAPGLQPPTAPKPKVKGSLGNR